MNTQEEFANATPEEIIEDLQEQLKEMTEYAYEKRGLLLSQVEITTKLQSEAYLVGEENKRLQMEVERLKAQIESIDNEKNRLSTKLNIYDAANYDPLKFPKKKNY